MQTLANIIQNALAMIGLLSILFALAVYWDEQRYKRQQENESDSRIQ